MLLFLQFDADEGRAHELHLSQLFYQQHSPVLRACILENALYWFNRTGYITTITCSNRTKEENDDVEGYEFSGHLTGYSDDLRTRDMSEDFREQYMGRLRTQYYRSGLYLIYHKNHLHVGIQRAFHNGNWAT